MAANSEVLQDPTSALPYELSVTIFSFVPAQDLVSNCVLVCRFWKEVSDDQTTWRLKCERTGRFRAEYMRSFEPDDWKRFYYINPYSRNLLENPNLSDAFPNIAETKFEVLPAWHGFADLTEDQWHALFVPWQVIEIGGDGLQLECPPCGSCNLPIDVGTVCISTSFGPCNKSQLIDLVEQGVSEYVLDECRLPIKVFEWFNGRFDCGCKYYLKVSLRDKRRDKIEGCKIKLEGEKPAGKHQWEKLEHVFRDYPPGVRYIHFEDYGRDTKYWKGFYGAKLSGATVKFLFD